MACSRYFVRRVERGKGEQEFGVGKDGRAHKTVGTRRVWHGRVQVTA